MRELIVNISLVLTLVVLGFSGYVYYSNYRIFNREINPESDVISSQIVVVKGHSLEPFIFEGEKLATLWQPEFLKIISRGEILIISVDIHAGPLVKIVLGLPGDKWSLVKNLQGHFNVIINGEKLKNPLGVEYAFPPERIKILEMLIKITKNVIPPETYLVFGADPAGTMDSSVFGLIDKEQILGKATRLN